MISGIFDCLKSFYGIFLKDLKELIKVFLHIQMCISWSFWDFVLASAMDTLFLF